MNLSQEIRSSEKPFLIAGPCSVETQEQVKLIANDLSALGGIKLLRGGIWKPRTRPDSFEGVGVVGLPWLVEAGKEVNIPTCTEVANASHVEQALAAGVDVLWIGARTTVNPFAVQEIAESLRGVKVPVMIKNPINPDLELWIGAFERMSKMGLSDFTAIHRGFSFYNHPKYRNVPNWEIPIAFRERMPEIPMINDPSHISGRRNLLLEVSQKAMDLDFSGLMIETHPDPDKAWSDAKQQVTASGLEDILRSIILRAPVVGEDAQGQLHDIRQKVGVLDDRLFELISERMRMSDEAGELKREHNITILQQEHWAKIKSKRMDMGDDYQLSPLFIRQLMDAIHQESIRHQTRIMNPKNEPDK